MDLLISALSGASLGCCCAALALPFLGAAAGAASFAATGGGASVTSAVTVARRASSTSTKSRSPCRESVPRPSTRTSPPVIAAAAKKYDALLASGSIA